MSSINEIQKQIGNERLVNLLRAVDLETAQTDDDHVADDETLIEKWAAGLLTVDEHELVLKHLAGCHECSQFIHDMTRAGIFENSVAGSVVSDRPDSPTRQKIDLIIESEPTTSVNTRWSENQEFRRSPRQRGIVVATAACALMALFGYLLTRNGDVQNSSIRLANTEFRQLSHYLSEAQFAAIVTSGGKGPKIPDIILPDTDRDQKLERLAGLIEKSPDDAIHKLNFGQVLLEAGQFEKALEQFEAANVLESNNPYALLGRGIAQFRLGELALAEQSFAAVADNVRVGVSARVNRALTLIALGRKDEARDLWRTVPTALQEEKISNVLRTEGSE
ncbi:MAG: tetratricopeptide repeat protein [Planctomycetaceae bacterium]|nr:tetratricopeptide repeat protein [Planctomycetaceae bacterium]